MNGGSSTVGSSGQGVLFGDALLKEGIGPDDGGGGGGKIPQASGDGSRGADSALRLGQSSAALSSIQAHVTASRLQLPDDVVADFRLQADGEPLERTTRLLYALFHLWTRSEWGRRERKKESTLWARSTKNPDVSTGPLARPFARSLAPLTRSLARSLRSLPRSWDSE